jgi:putative RNA 2'-phosphotransferase
MLRQCRAHGYYDGQNCPVCNEEGKFIMSEREQNGLGRLMAGVLRHFPEKFNLQMDINGWISTSKLCDSFKEARHYYHWLRPWHFEAIALGDEKGRYQVEGDMVRATYGHSIEIELDLPTDDIPEELYYPCDGDDLATHLELGIKAGDRQHVHLSKTITNAMEAGHVRIKRPRILEIDTERAIVDGHTIYRAGTTVFLSENIPALYLDVLPVDDQMIVEIEAVWEEE